jgi:hypothetical protein
MESQSTFAESKQKLLEKAFSSFEQLNSNLNSLNRNLETINDIGSQFKAPAHLWTSFHEQVRLYNDPHKASPEIEDTPSIAPKELPIDLEEPSLGEEERL